IAHDELSLAPDVAASLHAYEASLPASIADKGAKSDREALDEANQALQQQAARLSTLEMELQLRCESIEQLKQDADSSRRSASFAIDECQRLRAQLDEDSRARAIELEHLVQVQEQLKRCDTAREAAVEKVELTQVEISALQDQIKAAKKHSVELEERSSRSITEARARQADAELMVADRFREAAALTKLLAESEEARTLALSKASHLEARLVQLENGNSRLQGDVATLAREKLDLTSSLEDLSAQRDALLAKISNISEFLSQEKMNAVALVNSSSWRATAPLRRIRRVLGGHRSFRCPVYGADVLRLHMSNMFDAAWYLEQYQDIADTGIDPVVHYLAYGANEGRDPGPG